MADMEKEVEREPEGKPQAPETEGRNPETAAGAGTEKDLGTGKGPGTEKGSETEKGPGTGAEAPETEKVSLDRKKIPGKKQRMKPEPAGSLRRAGRNGWLPRSRPSRIRSWIP